MQNKTRKCFLKGVSLGWWVGVVYKMKVRLRLTMKGLAWSNNHRKDECEGRDCSLNRE